MYRGHGSPGVERANDSSIRVLSVCSHCPRLKFTHVIRLSQARRFPAHPSSGQPNIPSVSAPSGSGIGVVGVGFVVLAH